MAPAADELSLKPATGCSSTNMAVLSNGVATWPPDPLLVDVADTKPLDDPMVDHIGCGCGSTPPVAEKAGVSSVAWTKTAPTPVDEKEICTAVIFASGSSAIGTEFWIPELRIVVCAHGVLMVASLVDQHRPDEVHQNSSRRCPSPSSGPRLNLLKSRRNAPRLDGSGQTHRRLAGLVRMPSDLHVD